MDFWLLYLLFQLDSIIAMFSGIAILSLPVIIVLTLWYAFARMEGLDTKDPLKAFKIAFCINIPCALLVGLLPTTESMALIIGIHEVTNLEGVSELPQKLVDLLNTKLEEWE